MAQDRRLVNWRLRGAERGIALDPLAKRQVSTIESVGHHMDVGPLCPRL